MIPAPITRQEWRWALALAATVLAVSCLPYLAAWFMAPPGWQFAGVLVNPYDAHSYLAKMRQGFDGNWLFHLTYTAEPHPGAFINVLYLALGHAARLAGLPLLWMFHLARLAASLLLLAVAFRFVAAVTPAAGERRLAYALLCIASGLGWLGAIFDAFPIDLWLPEAFVPYSLFTNPHFPLGMALMLLILHGVVWRRTGPTKSDGWLALAALALALVSPFGLLTIGAVLAVYMIWLSLTRRRLPWPQLGAALLVGLVSAPLLGYYYWLAGSHPVWAGWSAQNVTPAPALLDLALGYGPVGLLALFGGWLAWRQPAETVRLPVIWVAVTIALVYLPINLQRRLITGLHIPLSLLAAFALARGIAWPKLRRWVTLAAFTLGALGTLFVWTIPLLGLQTSPAQSETAALFFLREDEQIALTWLREYTTVDDVVLAPPRLSLFVPEYTPARVVYGHPFETIQAEQKLALVEAFYRGQAASIPAGVTFVIYGPETQPAHLPDTPVLFSAGEMLIYPGPGNKTCSDRTVSCHYGKRIIREGEFLWTRFPPLWTLWNCTVMTAGAPA
jgi:hypothetical protein